MGAFKLAINMPGAVSAGAYTAGVLDFLIEALDQWEAAKAAGLPVPSHQVSIEALSGASAGGMCAAIAAVQLQEKFSPVPTPVTPAALTGNRLYDSWVKKIQILRLLETNDLAANPTLVSALDCTVLDEIATAAILPPDNPVTRPCVSPSLTLFLTVTNLRGTYYRLYDSASVNEYAAYFGDHLRFQYVPSMQQVPCLPMEPLPLDRVGGSWTLLREAALATGAFPLALAPRILERKFADFAQQPWPLPPGEKNVLPDFGDPPPPGRTFNTLNVDGGVTDNDPFALAHDYLAALDPPSPDNRNPRQAHTADRAVISIAPFPITETFSANFSAASPLLAMAARVLGALVSQSRFLGESLNLIMTPDGFSRFVIAPSTDEPGSGSALQCGLLGAFGGFFYEGFRSHDFLLGRWNCQRFLRNHLVYPADNEIIRAGLQSLTPPQIDLFSVPPPIPQGNAPAAKWIPLIPLCGTAASPMPFPQPQVLPYAELLKIAAAAKTRIQAVLSALLTQYTSGWKRRLGKVLAPVALLLLRPRIIADSLAESLGASVQPKP